MKFELYKDVALTRDLPEERLKRGGIKKLMEPHPSPDGSPREVNDSATSPTV